MDREYKVPHSPEVITEEADAYARRVSLAYRYPYRLGSIAWCLQDKFGKGGVIPRERRNRALALAE